MRSATQSKSWFRVTIVVAVLTVAVFINVMVERRAEALSLGDATDFIQRLFNSGNSKTQTPKTAPVKETTVQTASPKTNHPSSNNKSPGDTTEYKGQPISRVEPIDASIINQPQVLGNTDTQVAGSGVVATDSRGPGLLLRATSEGWQLMSLAWYWWLTGLAVVVLMTKVTILYLKNRFSHVLINNTALYMLSIVPMLILNKT